MIPHEHQSRTHDIASYLLKRNVSAAQTIGYALASLVGLTIILAAIQCYRDVSGLFSSDNNALQRDYLVVSKQIGLTDRSTGFTTEEIADLQSQPWVDSVGAFTAARFKAAIGVDFAGRSLATETFFESIPDRFFDTLPDEWGFDTTLGEDADVPIVLARDYLALYNFGFASTRGLPALRESETGMIPLAIRIYDAAGQPHFMRGHIAGFSSRINTIAVPEEFMKWANTHFAPGNSTNIPSRLVIEVNTPGDPAIKHYMRRHSLDIAGDKLDNSTAAYFLRMATGIVISVGAIITLLAFFILMLSIFLVIQKNREKLHRLMLLGYSPAQASRPYVRLIVWVNSIVTILSAAFMWTASLWWEQSLQTLGVTSASRWPVVAAGIIIMAAVSAVNVAVVRRLVRKEF